MIAPRIEEAPRREPEGGPRFALSFEDGRGLLRLARPLRFAYGTIEALELTLGKLKFPLDMRAGAFRFRTRRTRVRAARVRLDLPVLVGRAIDEPYRLAPLAAREDALAFALADPFGTLAFDVRAAMRGPDLWLCATQARAASEGPAAPLLRVLAAARAAGFELLEGEGAIRLPRVLSTVLMDALVPHGWRVPDDRSVGVLIEKAGNSGIALRTRADGEVERATDDGSFEAARRLAEVIAALSHGDRATAQDHWRSARERLGTLPPALAREAAGLGLEPPQIAGPGPLAASLWLRQALRDGKPEEASVRARAYAIAEPCDALAVEGLCAAAELAMVSDPALAAELLSHAAARRPSDPRLALRLVEALAHLDRPRELRAAIDAALASAEPGPLRGSLAREAAVLCELADRRSEAARLFRLAADHAPHDPRVLEGLALAREHEGALEDALVHWDRAAAAYGTAIEEADESRVLRNAGRVAERLGRNEIAEERLTRAARIGPVDAQLFAALARVRRRLGADPAAARAEDRLLETLQRVPAAGGTADVAAALTAAVRGSLVDDEVERARIFVTALARVAPHHPELPAVEDELDARDLRVWSRDPRRLLQLALERLARVLGAASELDALVAQLAASATERGEWERLAAAGARAADPRVGRAIAEAVVDAADRISETAVVAALEEKAERPEVRIRYALVLAVRHEADGRPIDGALARARAAALSRDTASLRAALRTVEQAGDRRAAREIVELGLSFVGDGPARRALEAARDRLL